MKVSIIRRESIISKPSVIPDDITAYYLETDTGKKFYYDHDKKKCGCNFCGRGRAKST